MYITYRITTTVLLYDMILPVSNRLRNDAQQIHISSSHFPNEKHSTENVILWKLCIVYFPSYIKVAGVFCRMNGRMCIVCLVPSSWGRPSRYELSSKPSPLWVSHLLLDDGGKIEGVREDVCFCSGVTNIALRVELLCHSHGFFGIDT